MAILKSSSTELHVAFHDLDNCGDIIYSYQLLIDSKNIINTEILKPIYRDGVFLTTECDFEQSGVIDFFKSVILSKEGYHYYESLEPPLIALRSYIIKSRFGTNQEFEEIILFVEIGEDYFDSNDIEKGVTFCLETDAERLEYFFKELAQEFELFKSNNKNKHLILSGE